MFLPGDWPLERELCNYGMRLPNGGRNADGMFWGSADEAVVAVKPYAYEGMATCVRGKRTESDMEVGGEGRNMTSSSRP